MRPRRAVHFAKPVVGPNGRPAAAPARFLLRHLPSSPAGGERAGSLGELVGALDQGDLTSLDLGIYQNQLSNAKMSLTNAIIDYKIELLNLKIQTLYDFEAQAPIIPEELQGKSTENK